MICPVDSVFVLKIVKLPEFATIELVVIELTIKDDRIADPAVIEPAEILFVLKDTKVAGPHVSELVITRELTVNVENIPLEAVT